MICSTCEKEFNCNNTSCRIIIKKEKCECLDCFIDRLIKSFKQKEMKPILKISSISCGFKMLSDDEITKRYVAHSL